MSTAVPSGINQKNCTLLVQLLFVAKTHSNRQKLLAAQIVAQNSKSCHKVAEHNLYRPSNDTPRALSRETCGYDGDNCGLSLASQIQCSCRWENTSAEHWVRPAFWQQLRWTSHVARIGRTRISNAVLYNWRAQLMWETWPKCSNKALWRQLKASRRFVGERSKTAQEKRRRNNKGFPNKQQQLQSSLVRARPLLPIYHFLPSILACEDRNHPRISVFDLKFYMTH